MFMLQVIKVSGFLSLKQEILKMHANKAQGLLNHETHMTKLPTPQLKSSHLLLINKFITLFSLLNMKILQ